MIDPFTALENVLAMRVNPATLSEHAIALGGSRSGREVQGFRFGVGARRVSLIAGAHADEPVGPGLLRRAVCYLASLSDDHPLLTRFNWWIVPHINPDGEVENAGWAAPEPTGGGYDPLAYLSGARREMPGDDIEFGFPRYSDDNARPEPTAVYQWWHTDARPFCFHASLHSMGFASGAWFLIDPEWVERSRGLMREMQMAAAVAGVALFDVDREGEKGFIRVGEGFSTRPNSVAMRDYFLQRGDSETASWFRPSSMETVRLMGGDPLTIVTEMPLFTLPAPDVPPPALWDWFMESRQRIGDWRRRLAGGEEPLLIQAELDAAAVKPLSLSTQREVMWSYVTGGLKLSCGRAG